jgi:hypothetical protein
MFPFGRLFLLTRSVPKHSANKKKNFIYISIFSGILLHTYQFQTFQKYFHFMSHQNLKNVYFLDLFANIFFLKNMTLAEPFNTGRYTHSNGFIRLR